MAASHSPAWIMRAALPNTFAVEAQAQVVRDELDREGFTQTAILAYAVKFASAYYGPFRDAGKKLVIRDFIYQKEEQDQFAKALAKLPIDIARIGLAK